MRRQWELVCLATGSLRRTPLRVGLTAAGVAIAVGALLSMVGLALGIQAKAEEPFQKMELFNRIDVGVPRAAEAGASEPATVPPPLNDETLTHIAGLPGVMLAYPELALESVAVLKREPPVSVAASSLPREADGFGFVREALVAGRFFRHQGGPEVILAAKLATRLGYPDAESALGQVLTLEIKGLAPLPDKSFRFERREVRVPVVGVWNPPERWRRASDSNGILLPVDVMKDLPGVHFTPTWRDLLRSRPGAAGEYERVVVRVRTPGDLFLVDKRLKEMGFHTDMLLNRLKEMRTAFLLLDLVFAAVGGVALVVAGLGIINTLLMAVLERTKEIGTFKALGASDGDIRLLFLTEAALVGLLGGVAGLLLGRLVSFAIERLVNTIAHGRGVEEDLIAFAFPAPLLAGALIFALVVSALSGVYPAARAARVDPIRALRGE